MKKARIARGPVRASTARRPPGAGYRIELTGALGRHETEALQIELRALAKRHGLVIEGMSVRRLSPGGSA